MAFCQFSLCRLIFLLSAVGDHFLRKIPPLPQQLRQVVQKLRLSLYDFALSSKIALEFPLFSQFPFLNSLQDVRDAEACEKSSQNEKDDFFPKTLDPNSCSLPESLSDCVAPAAQRKF